MADRTVVGWGYFDYYSTSVPAGLSNVVAIATAANGDSVDLSLALKADGTVVAWGNNSEGEGSVPAGLSNVVAVAAGGFFSLALKSDGTVVAGGTTAAGGLLSRRT